MAVVLLVAAGLARSAAWLVALGAVMVVGIYGYRTWRWIRRRREDAAK